MATRRATAAQQQQATATSTGSSLNHPHRQSLLRHLVLNSVATSPATALFFAERLHAVDQQHEPSSYILATLLVSNNRPHQAIHLLRQPVWFSPQLQEGTRYSTATRLSRPAIECSVRCARLYAQACLSLQRDKEGRQVLSKVLLPGIPLCPPDNLDVSPSSVATLSLFGSATTDEAHVVHLELARLARKAGEHERAIQSYGRVLEGNPWCWEAVEGLCAEGAPPDPDALYPPRPRPPTSSSSATTTNLYSTTTTTTTSAPISPLPNRAQPHPPPLGPSQTSAVNSFGFASVGGRGRGGAGDGAGGGGFFTPSDTATPVLGGLNGKGKEKMVGGIFGVGGGGGGGGSIWRRTAGKGPDVTEMSIDDSSSSFDTSFYPPAPLSYTNTAAYTQSLSAFASSSNGPSSSLFTPPTASLASTIAPGVKRTRAGGAAASSSTVTPVNEDDNKPPPPANGRRVVRGVPSEGVKGRRDASVGAAPPTRRSSRLSRDTGSSNGIGGGGSVGSSSMSLSRSQQTNGSSTSTASVPLGGRSVNPRDKKRSKAGAGPSVLSDAGSDALSPISHSSSPAPSSPGLAQQQQQQLAADPAVQEAEDYVAHLLRCFARAECYAAKFESGKAIEALMALPVEQQRTWRALVGVAKGHFERLDYEKAEKAFSQARAASPHLLDSMELYSTLLWHLRSSTSLSYLAQDLMLIAPKHPSSWIASGNVFSHLEDHAAALRCFKRAAQLDEGCVYAYTLSGHECVVLEEWERALGFFREAVRRDGRHYNAWFGLGNVYMQTGKYRLAEYHFRRAVEINPTNATLICCVGSVLEKLGQRRAALDLYETACLLAPESPAVRFKRVRILIALRQYNLAEVDLVALKDRAPNEFNVHFLLGKLYKRMGVGREGEMLKHFGLAQDLEPRTASMIREQIEMEVRDSGMEVDDDEEGEGEGDGE